MKPTVDLLSCNGNIFALLGCASVSLRKASQSDKIEKMTSEVLNAKSYHEALNIILQYVKAKEKMPNTILFYSVTGEYGCFSNFSKHSFNLDGYIWKTSEHYFSSTKISRC